MNAVFELPAVGRSAIVGPRRKWRILSRGMSLAALIAAILVIVPFPPLTPVAIHAEPSKAETSDAAAERAKADGEQAADAEAGDDAAQPAGPMRMVIHTTSKETGKPLSGVAIRLRIYYENAKTKQDMRVSNKQGEAVVELPSEPRVRGLRMDAKAQGMVPYHFNRNSGNKDLELPAEYDMPFEAAATIGGVVRDVQGNPIKGALVDVTYPATDTDMQSFYYHLSWHLKTSAEGRWKSHTVPKDFSKANISIEHPDYLSAQINVLQNALALGDESFELVLQQGLELAGQVFDAVGKPVAGANVLLGTSRYDSNKSETTTDKQGYFVLKNCKEGPQFLCVTSAGHAPDMRQMNVAERIDPLEIRLAPPATFRLRVLDDQGQPVADAEPVPEHWRGQQMLHVRHKVDAEGRWEWNSAPHDEVQFTILSGKDHLTMRNVPLTASDEEQIVTVHPKFRIKGKVTDAESGEAVKEFQMFSAFQVAPQLNWDRYHPATFKDGEYEFKFEDMRPGYALRIEADGYQPAETPTFTATECALRNRLSAAQAGRDRGQGANAGRLAGRGRHRHLANRRSRQCVLQRRPPPQFRLAFDDDWQRRQLSVQCSRQSLQAGGAPRQRLCGRAM